jgi:PAS domain S-box-containing protein
MNLAELLENLPGAVYRCLNERHWPILFISRAIEDLSGYPADAFVSEREHYGEIIHPEDRDRVWHDLQAALADLSRYNLIYRIITADGDEKWVCEQGVGVFTESGELSYLEGIIMDFTDIAAQEESTRSRLENAERKVARNERLAGLGQLSGGIAHELRSPLSVIQNAHIYLDAVTKDSDEDSRDALAEIRRGVARAERVISELLDYGRDTIPLNRDVCSIRATIQEAIKHVEIPPTVKLRLNIGEPEPACFCDHSQVSRLLENLLRNAVQAMPDGGELTVSVSEVDNQLNIEVQDTGSGIHEDELENIFLPLQTTKAKGIGLGLAICRRYATNNEGTIEVESVVGVGSVFRLTLPVTKN